MDSGWWKLQRVACRITKQTIIAWIQIVSLCNPGHKVFNMVMSFEQVTFYVSFLHVFHLSVYSRTLGHNMFDDLTGFHFNWSITVDILGIMCRNKMHLSPLLNVLFSWLRCFYWHHVQNLNEKFGDVLQAGSILLSYNFVEN